LLQERRSRGSYGSYPDALTGIRTLDLGLEGVRPSPLDDEGRVVPACTTGGILPLSLRSIKCCVLCCIEFARISSTAFARRGQTERAVWRRSPGYGTRKLARWARARDRRRVAWGSGELPWVTEWGAP